MIWLTDSESGTDVSRQGICGRGVLIDWYAWAQAQGKVVDATTAHAIPFSELLEALRHQGMSLDDVREGDILVVRSGYIEQYESLPEDKANSLHELYKTQKPENIGVEPSRELLEFLWEKRVAAVCGDSRSFEVWPCTQLQWHLHEWLLAGWGMPIGELFELKELSRVCAEKKRWTVFLSTSPMNVSHFLNVQSC
jgi:kynurenine formamidase